MPQETRSVRNSQSPHEKTYNDQDQMTPEVPATNDPEFLSRAETLEAREGGSLVLPCDVKDLGKLATRSKLKVASV